MGFFEDFCSDFEFSCDVFRGEWLQVVFGGAEEELSELGVCEVFGVEGLLVVG